MRLPQAELSPAAQAGRALTQPTLPSLTSAIGRTRARLKTGARLPVRMGVLEGAGLAAAFPQHTLQMLPQRPNLFRLKRRSRTLHDLDRHFNGRFIPAQSRAFHQCANIGRGLWLPRAGRLQSPSDHGR